MNMKKTKPWLLYFGRLETEKGFDTILDMLKYFLETKKALPFKIFIFGDGSLKVPLLDISEQSEDIHYFGRRSLEEIWRYRENCNYLLMPSRCLETFWLSALTACSWGLSVIGYTKGGQGQFIHPQYNLNTIKASTDSKKLIWMIQKILTEKPFPKTINTGMIKKYEKKIRIKHSKEIFWTHKKILIINDFIEKRWGIETYIHEAQELLQKEGHEVLLMGKKKIPKNIFLKYYYLIATICNIQSYWNIKKMIKVFKPDIIRYHNLFRYHGWMGMQAGKHAKAKKIMMYHDLGYFFPYPSKLENMQQFHYPSSAQHFFSSTPSKNPIKKLAARCKGLRNYPVRKQIRQQCDTHLVPSSFMEEIVHKSFNIPKKNIKTFPHFLQE